ncbi:MAG: RHS repeat-associated core domain-containing protein, partial [Planctomycetaceae bacterium]
NSQFQPWFAYTGREWDPAAGLYFYRARWYDPRAGRFLSEDPLGFAAGDVNLNRYVGNGATLWVDPSGVTATSSYANGAFSYNSYASYLQSMQAETGLPSIGRGGNQWDLLDYSANFAAGWGDALTFGITDWARSKAQINDEIDKSSVTYSVGFGVGILNGLPLVSASGGRAVSAGASGLIGRVSAGTGRAAAAAVSGVIARVGAAQLPYRTAVTVGVRMSRFFATATGYTQVIAHSRMWQFVGVWNRYVSTLRFGRYQRVATDCLTLQMHHWAIPRAIAKASQSSGLTRLAHAGWNLIPIPTGWNRFIGCSGLWFNMTRA